MAEETLTRIIRHSREDYGEDFKRHLLEQYKLYVESAEKISERRLSANNYLLTVNTLFVTLYGLLSETIYDGIWTVLVPLAGILVSLTWHRIITSYRDLNTVKFKVIHELENELPAALYDYEWQKAEEGRGKAYKPLTHLERWVPIVFIILYLILAIIGTVD